MPTCLKNVLAFKATALKFDRIIGSSSSPDRGLSNLDMFGFPISALFDDDLRDTDSPRLNDDLVPSASSGFCNKIIGFMYMLGICFNTMKLIHQRNC